MKVLVLGGTHFVGRHIVEVGLELGHEITIFNRGISNKELFPEVEKLFGDREHKQLDSLKDRTWDCAIDTIGFLDTLEQAVKDTTIILKNKVKHYTFISSVGAYSKVEPYFNESTPTRINEEKTPETSYGVNKARAEKIVTDTFGSKGLNVRAGMIVGKYEKSNRLTYWSKRIAEGGEVLAPVSENYEIQIIDAFDIARWIFKMIESMKGGNFNVVGPKHPITLRHLFEECKKLTGSDAEFTWISNEFLTKNNIQEWREIPFWTTNDQLLLLTSRCNIDKAIKSGLEFRPLKETIKDALEWAKIAPKDYYFESAKTLDYEKEQELLQKWKEEID